MIKAWQAPSAGATFELTEYDPGPLQPDDVEIVGGAIFGDGVEGRLVVAANYADLIPNGDEIRELLRYRAAEAIVEELRLGEEGLADLDIHIDAAADAAADPAIASLTGDERFIRAGDEGVVSTSR